MAGRKRRTSLCWILLLASAVQSTFTAAADADPTKPASTPQKQAEQPFDVQFAGLGKGGNIELKTTEEQSQWPLVIQRNESRQADAQVIIQCAPLRGPSGKSAEVVLKENSDPLKPTEAGTEELRFNLGLLGQKTVWLQIETPEKGNYEGALGLIVNGKRSSTTLKLERSPKLAPELSVVGVNADNLLGMTTESSDFDWPLTVQRKDSGRDPIQAHLNLVGFTGPQGTVLPQLIHDGNPLQGAIQIGSNQLITLVIKNIPKTEGKYKGALVIGAPGASPTTVKLELERKQPDLGIAVQDIPQVQSTICGAGAALKLYLRNDSNVERTLNYPQISGLDRVETADNQVKKIGTTDFRLCDPKTAQPVSASPIKVPANGVTGLEMTVCGLEQPGNYKGRILVSASDHKPSEKAFEIAMRLPLYLATIAITLGVLLSAVMRHYQNDARPRLLLQRDAASLSARLDTFEQSEKSDLVERERKTLSALKTHLQEIAAALAAGGAIDNFEKALGRIRLKLEIVPEWIDFRRGLAEVRPESVAQQIDKELAAIGAILSKEGATDEEIQGVKTTLQGLDGKLKEALGRYVLEAIKQMREEIEQLPDADQKLFEAANEPMEKAESAAKDQQLSAAGKHLDQARIAFADAGAKLLSKSLNPQAPPLGFEQPEWDSLVQTFRDRLKAIESEREGEQRIELWRKARSDYWSTLVEHLGNKLNSWKTAGIQGAEEDLKLASTSLNETLEKISAGRLTEVRTVYERAVAAMLKAQAKAGGGLQGKAPGKAEAAAGNTPEGIFDSVISRLLQLPLGESVSLAAVNRTLFWYDAFFAIILVVVAVLIGLKTLYVSDPDFGWWDLGVAFLWGAGLHAVAGQTFQGLKGLASGFK